MSVVVSPTSSRGQIVLQPSYFTSSLYVNQIREDITFLIRSYAEQYVKTNTATPFALFKEIWHSQGWTWLHFKVFDARSRDMFLKITIRLFAENLTATSTPLSRVIALFGLYTFYSAQPSPSAPPMHSVAHLPIPMDVYTSLLSLPDILNTEYLLPLQPYAIYVLSALISNQLFQILPSSELFPMNPRELPREIFVQDGYDAGTANTITPFTGVQKKRGRPTKREKAKKARDALAALSKWLDTNTYTYRPISDTGVSDAPAVSTHILLSHPPITSRNNYQWIKSQLLDILDPLVAPDTAEKGQGQVSLERANTAVLRRLQEIDRKAAEKGLEVGGEGGDITGLERVERAVGEIYHRSTGRRGGILGLLEGAGIEDNADSRTAPSSAFCPP